MRYWYGLILYIVAVLALNIEIKEKFQFISKSYVSLILLLILCVGYPRGYSYKYFLNNQNYYTLNIDYEEYDSIENEDGYGVISQSNKCYDVYYCTTFEYSDTKEVQLNKFIGNYYLFTTN